MNPRFRVAITLLSLIGAMFALDGCFRHRQQVVQRESMGYLRFTGNAGGATFSVVEANGVVVWSSTPVQTGKKYATRPGSYVLTVEKRGQPVLRRNLFLVDDEITDVAVP